ncbi:Gfo/Idh/MocA family oxidoreductase [Natronococcus wangiae]|uniref:Gfo/Idh/MocA family oxidoreductase n=1 Tax=Natronococcus wangiae TaxID=3068275 RepID=UPI0031338669
MSNNIPKSISSSNQNYRYGDETYFNEFTERDWQTTDDGKSIQLAVIGLGWFTRDRALPAIEKLLFCETIVIVSGSSEKAKRVAMEFYIEHIINHKSFRDGAASAAYDAVYIAVPNSLHLDYTKDAAKLGKHVLCEKPLEVSVDRAEQMVRACADADVILMTAYRLRTEPAVRRVREMIQDGVIGDPVQIHRGFSSRLIDAAGSDTWRLDPELAGGGALIDIGIYPLNTSRFLLNADPVTIQANTFSTQEVFDAVEENVAFQLAFSEGVTASCTASFNDILTVASRLSALRGK